MRKYFPCAVKTSELSIHRRFRGKISSELRPQAPGAVNILGIEQLLQRLPRQLSGGQQQRVALGRAIVRQPAAFLLDELLSALDAKLRVQMRAELVKLHGTLQTTMIYVTHDQVEAMTMGDRIVVMVEPLGFETHLYLSTGHQSLAARVSPRFEPAVGETIAVMLDMARLHLFDPKGGHSLL